MSLRTAVLIVFSSAVSISAQTIGVNVLLNTPPDPSVLQQIEALGQVRDVIPELNVVTVRAHSSDIPAIQALPCVMAANPDHIRQIAGAPPLVPDFVDGVDSWNLDAIGVTDFGTTRTVPYDGAGVYVAVIDTGLPHNWRSYFPEGRIDSLHARSFGGGGGEVGTVSSQPNKWEHDTVGHGVGVASIILGFSYYATLNYNGVAPRATVIPIKVDGNHSWFWISVYARAIVYATDLKTSGALGNAPLVINLSNGGPDPDAVEQAAIDYAIAHGVIVVACAGNSGSAGMWYPGAYPQVISAGAAGWVGEFPQDDPTAIEWVRRDVAEADPSACFVADLSSRQLPGQDLDVVAPGYAVPVAYTLNGTVDYTFFFGTSAASPHVAGVAALMLQKNPGLTQSQIENIMENTALPLAGGCRATMNFLLGPGNEPTWSDLGNVSFYPTTFCWGNDAAGHGLLQAGAALAATPMP